MIKENDLQAIIVAGGKGERLRPLTNTTPKPMVEVAGKPLLEHTLDLLKSYGIRRFIFALCYLPEVITSYFKDGAKFGVNISYTYEDPNFPLGTAGAISEAKRFIEGTFLVTYADILRELNVPEMVSSHNENRAFATLNVYQHRGANFKSILEFSKDRRLIKFTELSTSSVLETGYVWSNGSFYVFEPEIYDFIPEKEKVDFSIDIFPRLLSMKKKIQVYPSSKYFIDIGTPEKLEEARRTFIPEV